MELLKELYSDHLELKRLFKRLEMTTERGAKTREKLFHELKQLLDSHSKAEEAVLYEYLKKQDHESREAALEGYEEHHVAKFLLKELTALPKDSERWGAKLKVLKELIEHHVEEEEDEIFKDARKNLTREELQEMGEEFVSLKEAHLAGVGMPARIAMKLMRKIAS